VTFNIKAWPIKVEAKANGSWTATDSEKHVECIIAMRRHADGRALISYQSFENETPLSSWALMAMPKH
jgi:aminoglycoside phosphotransferase family enzyme